MTVPSVQERLALQMPIISPEGRAFLDAINGGETDGVSCWRASEVERRDGSAIEGRGLFAVEGIPENTLVAIKQGHVVGSKTIRENAEIIQGSHQQVGPNQFLAGLTTEEVDRNLIGYNHSCDPSARAVLIEGVPLALVVTRRLVKAGEEVTVDYSASQKTDTHLMKLCRCGAPDCRKVVAPAWDWEDESLQAKYQGEFAWFIQEAIDDRNNLPPNERQALMRRDATLKSAGVIDLLAKEIGEIEGEKAKAIAARPKIIQPIIEKLYPLTRSGLELQEFQEMLVTAAIQFCILCPFFNIDEVGVDRSVIESGMAGKQMMDALRPMVEKNLEGVIDFARKINIFND